MGSNRGVMPIKVFVVLNIDLRLVVVVVVERLTLNNHIPKGDSVT